MKKGWVEPATMPALSEKDFQRQVLDVAHIFGWVVYHPMLSKWSERGFPDLTMVRRDRLVFAELKRQSGKTSEHQDQWLALLGATAAEVYVWRPSDLETIAAVLA
jgi:hypothetical protein